MTGGGDACPLDFRVELFPSLAGKFHQNELVAITFQCTAVGEAGFLEAAVSTVIMFEGLQINPLEVGISKNIIYQGFHSHGAVALVPIVAITDHDPDFRLFGLAVDIVPDAVTDVGTISGDDCQGAAVFNGVFENLPVLVKILGERYPERRHGIQMGEFRITLPVIIIAGIFWLFGA